MEREINLLIYIAEMIIWFGFVSKDWFFDFDAESVINKYRGKLDV
jgi:hypothetical protein